MVKKATKKAEIRVNRKQASPGPDENKSSADINERSDSHQQTDVARPATYLTDDQLREFRRLLLDKLEEITGDVSHIESGALKSSRADASGDLSSMPIHMADIGSDNYEQEFALGLMNSERQIVVEIMAALRRIDNGSYGVCEGTGEPIPLTRLKGIPWTRYCVKYAESMEKKRGAGREPSTAGEPSQNRSPQEQVIDEFEDDLKETSPDFNNPGEETE